MANLQLSPGAYLITNKQTGTCLEHQGYFQEIKTATPDAHRRRELQIWWIEALPEHENDPEGPLYSIHNLTEKQSLDSMAGGNTEKGIIAARINGRSWQKWWIKRVLDDKEGEFYNIISVHKNGVLGIDANSEPLNSVVRTFEFTAENQRQRWEFVVPMVAIPPGWVQIRNTFDRSVLQQTYISSPPFLAPELHPSIPLNDRRNWGSQWLFLLEDGNADSPQCYWSIRNRLTGGFLRHEEERNNNGRITNVNAGEEYRFNSNVRSQMWRLQIQKDGYWSIINKESCWVLEKVEGEGTEVIAASKDSSDGNRRKWEFVEWRKRDCKAAERKPQIHRVL